MKSTLTFVTSALALTALLTGAASHATNLAELPLNASVLAKPNVVFGMDDSGSMDWEVLLNTNQGMVWWNGSTAWDSAAGKPLNYFANMYPYAYLMPVGAATGGAIYDYTSAAGQAAPPINQLAWLRSSAFNPLYYNTMVTYPAWSPAYVSGALKTYAAASTTATASHPAVTGAPTLNVGVAWSAASSNFSSNGYMFLVQVGMTLPVGTYVQSSSAGASGSLCSGSMQTLTAPQTVPSGRNCSAAIPYFPATFWQAQSCTVNGIDCLAAPSGSGTIKRYEIKSATAAYPSGRTYAAELQNFANWFSYYRKRKLMLAGAMGRVLEDISGLRLGVMPFNQTPTITMFDADGTSASSNRLAAAGQFYLNSMVQNGTPTHATVKRIGDQFNSNAGIVQYACQRNSMFIVTDGFADASSQTAPTYSQATYGSTAPFTATQANTLADFGLAYFTNRLRTDLPAGKVPLGDSTRYDPDTNPNLHITTYGLSLGLRGTLFAAAADPFATDLFATPPTWPTPLAGDPTMLDDLWHATVNGRGRMYSASDVDALRLSMQSAFNDILSQQGAQGSVAVSTVNLDRGDGKAYLGSYNQRGWVGDLERRSVNATTGIVQGSAEWLASSLLAARSWSGRIVFSASGSSGTDFSAATFGASANPNSAAYTNQQVVDYVRGDRSNEGTLLRTRSALLGPVVNGEPVLARDEGAVYVASGEGLLHAFDAATGTEQWAFVPPDSVVDVGKSVERAWAYRTLLDATPAYGRLSNGHKLLVGGLGAAGRSYYALDVTTPLNLSATAAAAQFKWTFPTSGDATNRGRMGYTLGKPALARTAADGDVVLVTSGYDNGTTIGDGKGRLWVLNAGTGAVIKSYRTSAGTAGGAEAGLAHVSPLRESDGSVRYVYGGDLLGNVWQFDLTAAAGTDLPPTLVATLKDASGNLQPVTAAPELVKIGSKRVILVGSGRVLDLSDFGATGTQTFYAIADGATLANARSGLVQRTYTRGGTPELSTGAFNWASDRGWYIDLPAGEQANTMPSIAYGSVVFVGNKNGSSDCSQQSWLYLVDIGSGSTVVGASAASFLLSNTATSSRAMVLRDSSGRLHATTQLSSREIKRTSLPPGDPIRPSKNAWKEIRR